jgi:tRNA A64-2'-O-ribosylphosphate transferase
MIDHHGMHGSNNNKKERQRTASRAHHRLRSIHYDVETFVRPTLAKLNSEFAVFANERCGAWYTPGGEHGDDDGGEGEGGAPHYSSCHFKSTDGHVGSWLFSLKRLNLQVIEKAITHNGCIIIDASVGKEMPDSFSRTISIWCATINAVVNHYQKQMGLLNATMSLEDSSVLLYTPHWIVSKAEHQTMLSLLEKHVESVLVNNVVVDPASLATRMKRPLRPFWVTPDHNILPTIEEQTTFYPIICVNCSKQASTNKKPPLIWMEPHSFWYTPGAADDHNSWSLNLQPAHFWKHLNQLLDDSLTTTEDETDQLIQSIVAAERQSLDSEFETTSKGVSTSLFDTLGELQLSIGSRRSARPPDCWEQFDAILNVTDTEYSDMAVINETQFYLQLPVPEGKRDRSELERWLAVGIVFCTVHARQGRRILIHCAQGKDRSVCVAMAVVICFCDLMFPLQWNRNVLERFHFDGGLIDSLETGPGAIYKASGLPDSLVQSLLGRDGRDRLLKELCKLKELPATSHLVSKQSLRVALHLIRQDREQAEPSRSNMQKLNRFFMSSEHEKGERIDNHEGYC